MANALSFLADPEYYKSAANVATGYGNQLADLLKEGKNRITSGRAILTGEPLAESLRNQYFSNDQNALASLAMDWANPVPVSGLVGGIISKGGKAVDALKYSDDVARSIPNKTEFEIAHEVAQRNAALPVEQGGLGLPANNTAMDRAKAMSAIGDDVSLIGGPSSGLRDAYIIGKKTRDVNPDLNTWAYTDEYKDTLGSFPWEENRTPAWEAFYRAGKLNREEPVMAIGSRYGEIPERGTSFNYRDQINERGVSMADVQNSNAAEWGDPISKTIIEGYGRPKINVGGYLIDDVGADGEPLLVAAKRLTGDYVIDSGKKRSRFAAFDPFRRNSANILAGGAAGGIGINALLDPMNQEEYQ